MRSDERLQAVRAASREAYAHFDTAIGTAIDQVLAYLRSRREQTDASYVAEVGATLGAFANGRLDAARFATLTGRHWALSTASAQALDRAAEVLADLLARGDAAFVHDVPRGGDMVAVVRDAFGYVGRTFGSVLLTRAVKSDVYRSEQHDALLRSFPFEQWNSVERRLTPPLVFGVDGEDLRAGMLSTYADGSQKLVLIMRGRCAPAPLARLITPGLFVQQAGEVAELKGFFASPAPGIAALVPDTSARFSHDPERGRSPAERIVITHRPSAAPRASIGSASVWQQADELAHLEALATATQQQVPHPVAAVPRKSDPAAVLAEWLLAHSGLALEEAVR